MSELKGQVEALLFSSGRPMHDEALAHILEADIKEIRKLLKEIHDDYAGRDGALKIFEDDHHWRMLVRDNYVDVTRRVVADTELTRPVMETLAVVAFHYPKILQSEVIKTRGGHAYDHIKELEEAGFMTRTKEGRSFAIKLTEKFFEYFDIEGADDIREFFKGIKVPVVEKQKKLGDMEIINVDPKTGEEIKKADEKELLGDLEVVDEEENPFMARNLGNKPEISDEEKQGHVDFLDELDAQIDSVKQRNKDRDNDESFQFKAPKEDEESGEGAGSEEESGEDLEGDAEPREETAEDVIQEVRAMSVDKEMAEEKPSALDEPLDLEKL